LKEIIPICVCPWCREYPQLMIFESAEVNETTWLVFIQCNGKCFVKPMTPYVPIRKSQKKDREVVKNKIMKVIDWWNENNPYSAEMGSLMDFDEIAEKGIPYSNQWDKIRQPYDHPSERKIVE
jgi:hypothetical protein